MAPALAQKDSTIVVVGAGIFGLSSALHLARRGFNNITVLDHQPYDSTLYSYDKGCDGASADISKIIRSAYGGESVYQALSVKAIKEWKAWNAHIASGKDLPPGLTSSDTIYVNNGNLQVSASQGLSDFQEATLSAMSAAGLRHTQYVTSDPSDVQRAQRDGFGHTLDAFKRRERGQPYQGVLDGAGGFVYADKACRMALYLARKAGVKFILHPVAGKFESYLEDASGAVKGIRTADGKSHPADLTLIAGGGWTQTMVPELDGLCETTAGSVVFIQIPRDSPLYDRFAPENFPSWTSKTKEGQIAGLYGFPRTESGILKIGYRGTKYPHPIRQLDGSIRSTPITRYTTPSLARVPDTAIETVKAFIAEFLPELPAAGIRITRTRLCWYNDSFDNHWVIDAVPLRSGLMVATGGSGHAFKFLPTIGGFVADRIQGLETEELRYWQWRSLQAGQKPVNVLMQGEQGERALQKQRLYEDEELELAAARKTRESRL